MHNSRTRLMRPLRPLVAALLLGAGVMLLSPQADAGGWHGGGGWGWHGGGGWGCCGWGWGGSGVSISLGWPGYYPYNPYPYYPPYSYAPPYGYAPPDGSASPYGYAQPNNYGQPPNYTPPNNYAPSNNYSPPPTQQQPAQAQSWYHCDNPQGYYPYVQSCGSGWRQVPATPPGMTSSQPQ
jgi:hypothetical protein